MRVLLIEDDSATAQSIELMLQSEGFNVYTTDLGEEGVDLGKLYDYDIILLDLNLPDMSGYEVLKTLRVSKVSTPILILSGLAGIDDKVRGLGFGADDYMTKPFDERELLARIRSLLRRLEGHRPEAAPAAGQAVVFAGWRFDPTVRTLVADDGKPVELTSSEFNLLAVLLAAPGKVLSRDHLMNAVYKRSWQPMDRSIDVLVTRLRRKLESRGQPEMIKTVRGSGYTFSVKIEPASGEPTSG